MRFCGAICAFLEVICAFLRIVRAVLSIVCAFRMDYMRFSDGCAFCIGVYAFRMDYALVWDIYARNPAYERRSRTPR